MPQQFKIKELPMSRKTLDKGIKEAIRFQHTHLVSKVTSDVLKQTYCFLQGYWCYMSEEIQPPYEEREVQATLISIGAAYVLEELI